MPFLSEGVPNARERKTGSKDTTFTIPFNSQGSSSSGVGVVGVAVWSIEELLKMLEGKRCRRAFQIDRNCGAVRSADQKLAKNLQSSYFDFYCTKLEG
eukprot:scaffold10909_cov172-Amphora_coffeaeformis.AAC.15